MTTPNRPPLREAMQAEFDGPAVPKSREPASATGEPSDEEIMRLMPQQMHIDLAYAARAMATEAGTDSHRVKSLMRIVLNRHAVDLARAVLARWGTPNQAEIRSSLGDAPTPVPLEGEVGSR